MRVTAVYQVGLRRAEYSAIGANSGAMANPITACGGRDASLVTVTEQTLDLDVGMARAAASVNSLYYWSRG